MSHLTQMAGLAVQNFVSAAVGIAVAIAAHPWPRARHGDRRSATSGSTWSEVVTRILLPLAFVVAVVLAGLGRHPELLGQHRGDAPSRAPPRSIPGGPVASQEAIKELGTNGGGMLNANSPTPSRTPTGSRTCSRCSSCS